MTDELKQWEYDKGYDKGKADMLKVLEDIKAEIIDNSIIETTENGLQKISYVSVDYVLSVIDKRIGEVRE